MRTDRRVGKARVSLFCCVLLVVAFSLSLGAQETEITNARVIEMTKLVLGDEIIIARIKTGTCKFAISDRDLAELKKASVSDKVIAAMLESSVLTQPRVTIDGNPVELHTIGQEKIGGRLGHNVSLHIKSVKEKAYLQRQHASVFAKSTPAIEIELPPSNSIDDFILVLMDGKGDRRELEVASGGGTVGHKSGIRSDRIVKTSYEPTGGRLYKISVGKLLKEGEYIVYIVGSADYEKGIFGRGYDFTVNASSAAALSAPISHATAPLASRTSPTASAPASSSALRPTVLTSAEAQPNPATAGKQEATAASSASPAPAAEDEGTASVTSDPAGAEIFVDSVGRGHAPTLLKLKPGKHKIQLVASGYKDWVAEIEVKSGSIVNVSGNLAK